MQKNIYLYILAFSAISLFVSAYIEIQKLSSPESDICSAIVEGSDCFGVQNSEYGKILGVDTAVFGILGFTLLVMLSYIQYRKQNILRSLLIIIGSMIAGIMGMIFMYLQAFVLEKYCVLCLIVDICAVITLVLSMALIFHKNEKTTTVEPMYKNKKQLKK